MSIRPALATATALLLLLSACNRPAADLPPDYGSVDARQTVSLSEFSAADQAMDCTAIDAARAGVKAEADQMTHAIRGNRKTNQTAGYIGGVLFAPALFALELDEEQKNRLVSLQKRDDTLIRLKFVKKCSRAGASAAPGS